MTRSTHTYSAFLIGSPDVELSVRGGRITLDSGRAPHVTAYVDVAVPDESILTDLDPRDGVRVRVEADAVFPSFSQSRVFDLGLRSRPMRHRDAVVSLDLASDEALLEDYRSPTDDRAPRALETSLRSIVNYALGKIAASLASVPANDADRTAYWDLVNYSKDPRGTVLANFSSAVVGGAGTLALATGMGSVLGTGVSTGIALTLTSPTSDSARIGHVVEVSGSRMYTFSMAGRFDLGGSATGSRSVRARVLWMDSNGNGLSQPHGPTQSLTDSGTGATVWARCAVTALAPASATHARIDFVVLGSLASGAIVTATCWQAVDGVELVTYFDGSTSVAGYACAWDSGTGPSVSTRTPLSPLDSRDPESLVWRAGDSALDFLAPLVQSAGYRLVCDEARVWTLRSAGYVAPGSLTIAHGVDMIAATDTLSRESSEWFDAQATRYVDPAGVKPPRTDYWSLTGAPTKVNLVEIVAPYPGTGRSEYAVRRAQGRGREVIATKVADWDVLAEQSVTVLLNGTPTQMGLTERVEFDLDSDELTVSTRTTDASPGSIDLLAGTIDSLVGFIDAL